jgi:tetratricopeptide (TPR) repeat protein
VVAVAGVVTAAVSFALYRGSESRQLARRLEARRQVDALWGEGGKAEEDARRALARRQEAEAARHLDAARGALGGALAALDAAPDGEDEGLRRRITSLLSRVQRQTDELADRRREEQARRVFQERVASLARQRDELLFQDLAVVDAERAANREAIRRLAPAALALFGIAPDRPPAARGFGDDARFFESGEQRRHAAAWCCEVLLVWADAEAGRQAPGLKEALKLLGVAQSLAEAEGLPPSRALHERRAGYLASLGDAEGARAESALAKGRPAATARDHFLLALDRHREGKPGDAARACEAALRAEPGHFWAQYLLGLCHLQARQWGKADAWFTTCLSQRPEFFWALVQRGAARVELKDLDGAGSDLESASRQAKAPLERYALHMTRGRLADVRRRWPEARDELSIAASWQPAGAHQARVNLARVYREMEEYPAALRELGEAITLRPADGQLYYTRAQVHKENEDLARARSDFERAVALAPKAGGPRWLASALVELGYLKHLSGDFAAALADFDAALAAVKDYPPAHRQRAETLSKLGRTAEAGAALDAYLKASRDPEAYLARGLIHASLREYPQAVAAYSRALETKPGVDLLGYRGWAYLQSGSLTLALADFEEALKARPTHADALCGRGQVRALTGKVRPAVEDAEAALKHGGRTETMLCNVAGIYARAARRVEEEERGPRRALPPAARRYEERAVDLLAEAVRRLPAERKRAFWREKVEKDEALRTLWRNQAMQRLARAAAPP